jgi:hypothetical protein
MRKLKIFLKFRNLIFRQINLVDNFLKIMHSKKLKCNIVSLLLNLQNYNVKIIITYF